MRHLHGARAGRPTSSTRLRREECSALPVRMLPYLPPRAYRGLEAVLQVSGDLSGVLPFQFRLRVIRTSCAWLCFCPHCGRRAAVIYFPPGSPEPGCRVCLRLVYSSQYEYMPEWAVRMRAAIQEYVQPGAPL